MAFPLTEYEHNYIEARIQEIPEIIVAAAVRYGDIIVFKERPGRHSDALNFGGRESRDHGFVTSRGRFVDREEAGFIVKATGQGLPRPGKSNPKQCLFSEDMWHNPDIEGPFADEEYKAKLMERFLED